MELALWRWSTAAQVTSAVMILAFFAAMARADPRAELRWWAYAWMANAIALGVALIYWVYQPPEWTEIIIRAGYLGAKTTFVVLFLQGAWALMRPGTRPIRGRIVVPALAILVMLGAILLEGVPRIGIGQHLVMGVLFATGAIGVARSRERALTWLAVGMAVRGSLALIEASAYGLQLMGAAAVPPRLAEFAGWFVAASSFLDTGAEWLLVLGCVLGVADRSQRQLRAYNARLLTAQEDLRRLADRDPLTALPNRRSLPEVFRAVQPRGALVLFFDLDGFKEINDLHGHHAGDDCLIRFATALRECFRPEDAVIRYGGDEFVVIASGLDRTQAQARLGRLRERLYRGSTEAVVVRFSVGLARLEPGGQPDAALQAADSAMYRSKSRTKSGRRRTAQGGQ